MPINAYPFTPTVKSFDRPFPSSHRLILASASPRRRELLERMGLAFTVLPADADETISSGLSPRDAVGLLSVRKAYAVLPLLEKSTQKAVFLTADTIVDFGGRALGKPTDEKDAFDTLMSMSGSLHKVHTGCAVLCGPRLYTEVITSTVHMRSYTEDEVRAYVNSGECMGKAGSYAIQGLGGQLISHYEGALDNIVGLPTRCVADLLLRALENEKAL